MARHNHQTLRRGWTTGSCATAAAVGACHGWVNKEFPRAVSILLPKGQKADFILKHKERTLEQATASIIKDAGDDPDVTHGAEIIVSLRPADLHQGLIFHAGSGVGVVRMAGLPIPVGEPAINPVPRRMIFDNLALFTQQYGGGMDWHVTISIPNGEEMARKTWNPRLGIEGGLSILGTSGIVIPYSCSAWIHSIHSGIDVARAANLPHIAACTGSVSEQAAAHFFGLPLTALIDMGDFAGAMLKYLRRNPVKHLTIAGGMAKITKLAQAKLDLHSSRSQIDFPQLAKLAGDVGLSEEKIMHISKARAMAHILGVFDSEDLKKNFFALLAKQAQNEAINVLGNVLGSAHKIDILIVDRQGKAYGWTGGDIKDLSQ